MLLCSQVCILTHDCINVKSHSNCFLQKIALRETGVVYIGSSEENPLEIDCGCESRHGYSVAFDPLDGSSIVDVNFAVGTITGIWSGRGLLGRTGREQVASSVVMYGPRVTIALALNSSACIDGEMRSLEMTMLADKWVVSRPRLVIGPTAKTFAPGNLRATSDNSKYKSLLDHWISKKYTLRYSGGLVPDVYHILVKGEGVLSNASSASAKAKLRLLYECAPIALVIEGICYRLFLYRVASASMFNTYYIFFSPSLISIKSLP